MPSRNRLGGNSTSVNGPTYMLENNLLNVFALYQTVCEKRTKLRRLSATSEKSTGFTPTLQKCNTKVCSLLTPLLYRIKIRFFACVF